MNRTEERELSKQVRRHLIQNPHLRDILLDDVPLVVTGQGEYRRGWTPSRRSVWDSIRGAIRRALSVFDDPKPPNYSE